MLLLDIPPLDSIYYTPSINLAAGARSGAIAFSHVLFWTPQIIWATLAALLLVRKIEQVEKGQKEWSSVLLPYAMVLLVIVMFWLFFGLTLGPIRENDPFQQALHRAMYKDFIIPSLWAIPGLCVVHIIKFLDVLNKRIPNQ